MTAVKSQINLYQIWEGFHWLFIVQIQGLIICLQRFEIDLNAGYLSQAEVELGTAADLMLASGAAMELAGSFTRKEYENQILPTMKAPQVASENFSGLMSWDHASLIKIWKKLRPLFETLPAELDTVYSKFVNSYMTLSGAHKAVCTRFGGDDKGSLRCNKCTAVSKLENFEKGRLKMLDPNSQVTHG